MNEKKEEGLLPLTNPLTLGIDLGTTNSCAAVFTGGQAIVLDMEQPGLKTIPSVVRFKDRKVDDTIVGIGAKKYKIIKPNEVFSSVKTLMQDEKWRDDAELVKKYTFGDVQLAPKDIAERILAEVLQLAQRSEYGEKGSFQKVVICVPANSTPQYKDYVKDIAKNVGFGLKDAEGNYLQKSNGDIEGITLLSEPSAAAICYAMEKGLFDNERSNELNLLIYDFGGGTFDVTILSVANTGTDIPTQFTVKGTYGVPNLGGDDIDQVLMEYVASQFYDETGVDLMDSSKDNKGNSPKSIHEAQAWLKQEAENAKIQFSSGEKEYTFDNPDIIYDNDANKSCSLDCIVTLEKFEDLIKPIIDKSLKCVEEALKSTSLTFDDINRFIIVGGSSKGPWVSKAIKSRFGREPYSADNLDTIVARGAAIFGEKKDGVEDADSGDTEGTSENKSGSQGGISISELTAQSIGVELKNGFFSPLIEKGTKLTETDPCVGTGRYTNADQSDTVIIALWGTGRNLDIKTTASGGCVVYEPVHGKDDQGENLFDYYGEVPVAIPVAPAGTVDIVLTLTVYMDNSLKVTAVVNGGEPQEQNIERK